MIAAKNSRRGLPPRFIEIEEKTEPWMLYFIEVFFELSTERPSGFSRSPIPWSKIMEHAEESGFTGVWKQTFRDIVRKMDTHYIAREDTPDGKPETVREKNAPPGRLR